MAEIESVSNFTSMSNETLNNDTYNNLAALNREYFYDESFATVMAVEKVYVPVVCTVGLIGNSFSVVTFLRKPLRKAPCSIYLAARGISDNGFLLSLLLVWISSTFQLNLSRIKGVCQFITFMTYVCGCVSVWLCVFITFENFLLIQCPFAARRICSVTTSGICIAVLVVISCGIYNISLWIIEEDCSHNPAFSTLTQLLVYSDTLLTLVIPTIIIFILLTVIVYRMIKIIQLRRLHENVIKTIANKSTKRTALPIGKVTKLLFVVSSVFLVLNVPSHVIRLMLLIGTFIKGHNTTPPVTATVQVAFQFIYYLSFSINIVVYVLFGSNFRKSFKKMFCKGIKAPGAAYIQTEAVNLVRHRRNSIDICAEEKQDDAKYSTSYLMLSTQEK